jgi:hypothetical protein
VLSLPTVLKNGGILGFHCAHQYPDSEVGTYCYSRPPHALKGIDAALFTIPLSLGLAVPIWFVSESWFSKEDTDAAPRFRDLIIIEEEAEGDLKAGKPSVYQDQHQNLNATYSDTIKIKGRPHDSMVAILSKISYGLMNQQIIALGRCIKRLRGQLPSGLAMKSRSTGGTRFWSCW